MRHHPRRSEMSTTIANHRRILRVLGCFALAMVAAELPADEARSPVVGYLRFDCPPGSDTRVSVPFHPAPRWAGRVAGAPTDEGGGRMRLVLAGSPAFDAGELADGAHYLLCREPDGPEGRHFPIVASGADHVEIEAGSGDLAGLAGGGLVSVIPGWTLAALFPPDSQTTFHPSTGRLATGRGSELLLPDTTTEGINLAPDRRYFLTESGWVEGGSFAPAGGVVLEPGRPFVVRHPDAVAPTAFVATDFVYGGAVDLAVPASASRRRDTALAPPRPVVATLDQLGLSGELFEESPSTDAADRRDELLVHANVAAGRNPAPSAVYFRTGGQWVEDAEDFPAADAVEIEPAAGLVLRKASSDTVQTLRWRNLPTYDLTAP